MQNNVNNIIKMKLNSANLGNNGCSVGISHSDGKNRVVQSNRRNNRTKTEIED